MLNRLFALHIILFFIFTPSVRAQLNVITSAENDEQTSYIYNGETDTIFLFSASNPNKFIRAESPNDSLTTFEWYAYNPITRVFDFLRADNDVLSSTMTLTQSDGYRLVITGHGNNITSEFWAIINDLSVDIYNADVVNEDGEIYKEVPLGQKWCHLIRDINARIDTAYLEYYDLNTGDPLRLENRYRVIWSADPQPDELGINHWFYNDEYGLRIDIEDPYWEDSWYYITIEDDYAFTATDSIFYESIEPHADFSYEYITLDNPLYYPDRKEPYYEDYYNSEANYDNISAPALFRFDNLSINADTMIWIFGDGEKEISGLDSLLHTYQLPGEYYPKLTVYNIVSHLYEACTDTFPKYGEEVIFDDGTIWPPTIETASIEVEQMYNVITIPPDGINDYFRFTGDVSITDFEIAIYNRYGNRVYAFKGNIRDWEGWDGTDDGSSNFVHTGVYFYVVKVINALPSDSRGIKPKLMIETPPSTDKDAPKKNTVFRGFIHVYNQE